jgi:hypothetical protein
MLNAATRIVASEVLPAGTFGTQQAVASKENKQETRKKRRKRLRQQRN